MILDKESCLFNGMFSKKQEALVVWPCLSGLPGTRFPKKVLYGEVTGRGAVGRPRKFWNGI